MLNMLHRDNLPFIVDIAAAHMGDIAFIGAEPAADFRYFFFIHIHSPFLIPFIEIVGIFIHYSTWARLLQNNLAVG